MKNVKLEIGWTLRLAVGLVVMVVGAGLSYGQTPMLVDDFNDGDDQGWTHWDNTVGQPWGPGTFDASSGAYHLLGGGAVPEGRSGGFGAWWDASTDPLFSDGFLKAKIRTDDETALVMLVMRLSEESGYFFGANAIANRFYLSKLENGSEVLNPRFQADEPFLAGEDWMIEVGAVGDQLSMKMWKAGDPEPSQPQWTDTDSSPLPPGAIGVASWHWSLEQTPPGTVDVTFDDIYFTPIPEPSAATLSTLGLLGLLVWRRLKPSGFDPKPESVRR